MTEWTAFNLVGQNIVQYFTGGYAITAYLIIFLFIVLITAGGLEFKYSLAFSLPLLGAFAAAGWFGVAGWVINVGLIIVAMFYGYALVRIIGGG